MSQDPRAVVKNVDMSDEMQTDAIDISTQALDRFNIEKDIAASLKKEFEGGKRNHIRSGESAPG
jgi:dynein light chain LC8-type